MDDIIEFAIELLGELLGEILGSIKNPTKRKWALTIFCSVFWLAITAFCGYFTIALGKENNLTGTIVIGVLTCTVFLGLGFLVIRGHRQNWKKH